MSKAIALTRSALVEARQRQTDVLSSAIVLGCASALILAGKALPF